MPYKDIKKRREAGRKSYAKNRDYYRKKMNLYNKQYRQKKRDLAKRFVLFKGCLVCGYKRCHRALHFHHLDPSTKKKEVSLMTSENYGMKIFKEEIRKCVVLCANCHAEVHEGIIKLK